MYIIRRPASETVELAWVQFLAEGRAQIDVFCLIVTFVFLMYVMLLVSLGLK